MRRLPSAWLPLLALAVLVGSGCAEPPEVRKGKALERGRQYLEARKLNEAVIEFQNALQADRDFVPALHGLGRAYAAKYWFLDAVRELGRARGLAPDSLEIAADLGRALLEVGEWDEAGRQAEAILARSPQDGIGLFIRAGVLLGRGKFGEALAALAGAPASFPGAELARAEALFGLGKTDQAEQVLRGLLARDPRDARSLAGLGVVHLSRKNYAEAARLYAQARDLQPEDPRIRLGLAAALARLGKLREAIAELEQVSPRARTGGVVRALGSYYLLADRPVEAVQLLAPVVTQLPRHTAARFLLGLAYLAAGEAHRALTEFSELERQLPKDPAVQLRLAQAEARLGQAEGALARLEPIASAMKEAPEYHVERGRALVLTGRLPEALRAAQTAQRLAPRLPQPYLLLGEIRSQQGDLRGAREHFAKAAEVDAGFLQARLALGRVLLAQGEGEAALREFDAAVRTAPHSLLAAREKVRGLLEQGRPADAIAFVRQAVKADPRSPGFHALLGALHLGQRQLGEAQQAYRQELDVSSRSIESRMGLATIALLRGREEDAVAELQHVVRLRADHPAAVLLLASLLGKQGRADLAVPVVEAAAMANPRDAAFALTRGDLYLKTGRYEEAIAVMTETLARTPGLARAQLIRAQAHLGKNDPEAALRDLDHLARGVAVSAEVHYFRAHAHAAAGRMPQAQAAYREALRLDPRMEAARLELAALSGQPVDEPTLRQQVEALRVAARKDPKNVLLRESLARALFLRGEIQGAQAELQQILAVAPLHMGANFLTARTLLHQGKAEEAARYLEAVLRSNPAHVESLLLLARHLESRGQLVEASAHLETALRTDPNVAEARYRLGRLYARTGRLDEALTMARDLQQSPAGVVPGRLLAGLVLLEQGRAREAREAFAAVLAQKPDLAEAHRGLGQAWEALQQPEKAMESYRRALALDGGDAVALNNLAWVLAEQGRDLGQALAMATRAAGIAPRSPEVLDTLGWIHYRRGAYAEAERVLARAAELAPGKAAIHYHLGLTYQRLGKKHDAVSTLRRAASLDPALAAREKIGDLIRELGG